MTERADKSLRHSASLCLNFDSEIENVFAEWIMTIWTSEGIKLFESRKIEHTFYENLEEHGKRIDQPIHNESELTFVVIFTEFDVKEK